MYKRRVKLEGNLTTRTEIIVNKLADLKAEVVEITINSFMNSLLLPSSLLLSSSSHKMSPLIPSISQCYPYSHHSYHVNHLSCFPFSSAQISSPSSKILRLSSVGATIPSSDGSVSVINFEDFVEKDWSFLESDNINSIEEHNQKINQILAVGDIGDNARVMVSVGSEEFVDRVVDHSSQCDLLLIVHDSLFVLAGIKEKYDKVKCWQGELIYVPEKWAPFDVVFLYFLPGLPFDLAQIFGALSKCCSPGARVVISHLQGREAAELQKKDYPDVAVSELPDKMTLESISAHYSFKLGDFVDEPRFYLAVLKFCMTGDSGELNVASFKC